MLLVNIKEAIFFRNNIFKEVNMNYLANFHEYLKKFFLEIEKLLEKLSKEKKNVFITAGKCQLSNFKLTSYSDSLSHFIIYGHILFIPAIIQ